MAESGLDEELRTWREGFDDATPIDQATDGTEGSFVGVVRTLRLNADRSFEVVIADGSGEITGFWERRDAAKDLTPGQAVCLTGRVEADEHGYRLTQPSWEEVEQPY